MTTEYRIKDTAAVYPGKILVAEPGYEDDAWVIGRVRVSRNRYATGLRQFPRDQLEALKEK